MRDYLPVSLLYLSLMGNCYAQTTPTNSTEVDAAQSTELTLRVLQYEVMLGSELGSTLAVCVDEGLQNAWMLPEKAQTEFSGKAVERIRRRLEICQAGAGSQTKDLRLAGEIRIVMEAQLKAARALELSKNSARSCLSNSQMQDSYKACMATVLPVVPSEFQWTRWLALFERHTSFAAFGEIKNN